MTHFLSYVAMGFVVMFIGYLAYRDDEKGASKDPAEAVKSQDGATSVHGDAQ